MRRIERDRWAARPVALRHLNCACVVPGAARRSPSLTAPDAGIGFVS